MLEKSPLLLLPFSFTKGRERHPQLPPFRTLTCRAARRQRCVFVGVFSRSPLCLTPRLMANTGAAGDTERERKHLGNSIIW